jgi:hypothetical protein
MQIFNDLMKLYEEIHKTYHESDGDYKHCLENKKFEKVPGLIAKKDDYLHFKKRLKVILKENFKTQIELEIDKAEKEYEKQKDFSKSAWDMYGSELAGDLNSGEVKAGKKLKLLKGIME